MIERFSKVLRYDTRKGLPHSPAQPAVQKCSGLASASGAVPTSSGWSQCPLHLLAHRRVTPPPLIEHQGHYVEYPLQTLD
jgi:hypothetical protein